MNTKSMQRNGIIILVAFSLCYAKNICSYASVATYCYKATTVEEDFRDEYHEAREYASKVGGAVYDFAYRRLARAKGENKLNRERILLIVEAIEDFTACLKRKKIEGNSYDPCRKSLAKALGAIHSALKKVDYTDDRELLQEERVVEGCMKRNMKESECE